MMKKFRIMVLITIMMMVLTACGKQGNPVVLPDREEIISIDVSDEEKSGFSPNTEGEAVAQSSEVDEITVIEQEETDTMDRVPMVRVNGRLYYDTGKESTLQGRCGIMDGQIASTVDGSEIPTEDNQSNFGSGFGYQYVDDTIEIFMNEKWCVFEYREE